MFAFISLGSLSVAIAVALIIVAVMNLPHPKQRTS
jgi:hypothetical protein